MTEQEVNRVEKALEMMDQTISTLQRQITKAQEEIGRLEDAKVQLVKLLPKDKRIDRLFE
jgi:prefoldin subunit 5